MAVALDTTSAVTGTTTSLTVSHTTSGSDRVMYVGVLIDSGSAFEPSVTYNGVSLTKIVEVETSRYIGLFRLIAPDTGAHDVVVSSLPGGGAQAVVARTFTGVDQTTPEDTPVTSNGTGASVTNDVASAIDDLVADLFQCNNTSNALTVGAGQTEQANAENTGHTYGASTEPGAGTVTMSWSWSNSVTFAHVAWNINAAAGGGGGGELTWVPQQQVAAGRAGRMVASGMTPPGRVA